MGVKSGGIGGCQRRVPQIYGWRGMSWGWGPAGGVDEVKYSCIRRGIYTKKKTLKENTEKENDRPKYFFI